MNIFEYYQKKILSIIKKNKDKLNLKKLNNFKGVVLESPPDSFDSDISSNVALILAKLNGINPKELSQNLKILISKNIKDFDKIEVAGPGFLNFDLSHKALIKIINSIYKENNKYGSQKSNLNYNIEFVSANPTGPMHVGHCRGAIFGDTLSNLLKFNGNKITREYYINDYGTQTKNFIKSIFLRIREIKFKENFPNDKNLYPGNYIKEIAEKILKEKKLECKNFNDDYDFLYKESLKQSMKMIKSDLKKLGISHDKFVSEKSLVDANTVKKAINHLKKTKYVEEGFLEPPKGEEITNWKKIKRLIFKSTFFGDDTDRALQKNDGSWTYFANDVAYHFNKVSRKYDKLINVLGADHTGYLKRIQGAVSAISKNKIYLECKVCQLVKLFKNGQPYKMSKRAGEFISVSELLEEVNKDSIRFMMLNRSNDVELDFDFDKVLEKSKENPVYYVQYCHARIKSLLRSIKYKPQRIKKIKLQEKELNKYQRQIIRKILDWPKVVKISSNKYEPHRIPFYLYELSTIFHSYWSKGNDDDSYRFIKNGKISSENIIVIINLLLIVLKNGMGILNVSLPEKM